MNDALKRLRALEKAATPGPWAVEDGKSVVAMFGDVDVYAQSVSSTRAVDESDAALVAAARNALPLLLDVAEAAQKHDNDWGVDIDCESIRNVRAALDALAKLELP
jgi:hypothetical protein